MKTSLLLACLIQLALFAASSVLPVLKDNGKNKVVDRTKRSDKLALLNLLMDWSLTTPSPRTTLPPLDTLGGMIVHKGSRDSGLSPSEFAERLYKLRHKDDNDIYLSNLLKDEESDQSDIDHLLNEIRLDDFKDGSDDDVADKIIYDDLNENTNEIEKRGLNSLGGMSLHGGFKRGLNSLGGFSLHQGYKRDPPTKIPPSPGKRGLNSLGGLYLHNFVKRGLNSLGGMSLHSFNKRGLNSLGGMSLHGYKRGLSSLGGMGLHSFRKRGLNSLGGFSLHGGYKRGLSSLGGMSLHGGFGKRGLSSLGGMSLHGGFGKRGLNSLGGFGLHSYKRGLNSLGGMSLHNYKRGLSTLGGNYLHYVKRNPRTPLEDHAVSMKKRSADIGSQETKEN